MVFRLSRRAWLLACLPGLLLLLVGLLAAVLLGWRINTTASLPMGIWKIEGEFHRGSFVSACLPPDAPSARQAMAWGYFHDGTCPGGIAPLLKEVVALPGDTVELSADQVRVNGRAIENTQTITQDMLGRHIHPIARGRYQVAPNTYWLIANFNPGSYDSRYFGPIHKSQIQHVMRPVWLMASKGYTVHDDQ